MSSLPAISCQQRKATKEDLGWLLELRLQTMAAYIEASGQSLSLDEQQARVERDFDSIGIVTLVGHDVGMIKVVREPESWKLVQIQILPEHQGRGIGTSILSDLIAAARRVPVALTLSVLKVNPARRLYERLGFRIVADKERSYDMTLNA